MPSTPLSLELSAWSPSLGGSVPFDSSRLDDLLDDAGIDVVLVTSKHNIQYLLGGYRFFFYEFAEAVGVSRYLAFLIYVKGRPEASVYIASPMEDYERELGKFWVPTLDLTTWGTLDAAETVRKHLDRLGPFPRIGVEASFLPADAYRSLQNAFPNCEFVDANFPLERLRARKTEAELDLLREASERVVNSMLAVFRNHGQGATTRELTEALRVEEVSRGLTFDYCLIATGASFNRSPSGEVWRDGEVLSLDSGANYKGYIGDLCRMGILGEPDAELQDLLAEIEEIQQTARRSIRAGTQGGDLFEAPEALVRVSAHRGYLNFIAHGMGIVSHEAPRVSDKAPQGYDAYDAARPLEAGMVLSIETTMAHPRRGFIKLEDTVAVTESGWTAFGDGGRGWNQSGFRL